MKIMDAIDQKIIQLLKEDARQTHKDIGEKVHKTGQAVGQRIQKLEDSGVIQKFTIETHSDHTQFISFYMNDGHYVAFENFLKKYPEIAEVHKVSGDACYLIKAHFPEASLDAFLTESLRFGRYKLATSLKRLI